MPMILRHVDGLPRPSLIACFTCASALQNPDGSVSIAGISGIVRASRGHMSIEVPVVTIWTGLPGTFIQTLILTDADGLALVTANKVFEIRSSRERRMLRTILYFPGTPGDYLLVAQLSDERVADQVVRVVVA